MPARSSTHFPVILVPIFCWLIFPVEMTAAERTKLPANHPYQTTLRDYLGALTTADFDHGVTDELTTPDRIPGSEEQYRLFIMTLMHQPLVGWKRGAPAINAPSKLFLLSAIEGPAVRKTAELEPAKAPPSTDESIPVPVPDPEGIVVPPVWPETLAAFVKWEHAGNPYFDNPGLKRRAFVTAAVKMIMLDEYFEKNPEARRPDLNGYKLACYGSTYLRVKDAVTPEARAAFQEGLLKLGREMLLWPVVGEQINRDLSAVVGLWYVAQACDDEAFEKEVEDYARHLITENFHPAGYWIERGGGPDVAYGGGANFYTLWAALAADWPFAKDRIERAYRLRSHLSLPDPDGVLNGPSHFNTRIGGPACSDQWHWDGARDHAAAMITDEALCLITLPAEDQLAGALENRIKWFNFQIRQNLVRPDLLGRTSAQRTGYWANEDLRGRTWTWRLWQTYNFPIGINVGYDFYRPDTWARLSKLRENGSPTLKTPFERGVNFTRIFGDAFVVTRKNIHAAILHTGPVGELLEDDGLAQYPGPLGFGGGQLSAFWTPDTGSVILGRRSGTRTDVNYDTLETWRQWPIHAISGQTTNGAVFSSARCIEPELESNLKEGLGTVRVRGEIPALKFEQNPTMPGGSLRYERTFTLSEDGVHVESSVMGDRSGVAVELYETIPVFLRDAKRQRDATPTIIEWEIDGRRVPATTGDAENVSAVLLTRFNGTVRITFDTPRRVKLSPEVWEDTYVTRATCRNVLIDLLGKRPGTPPVDRARVGYRISASSE